MASEKLKISLDYTKLLLLRVKYITIYFGFGVVYLLL